MPGYVGEPRGIAAPATVGQAAERLVQRGLCAREPDPADRRARLLAVTAAGRALLAEAPTAGPVRPRYAAADPTRLGRLADALDDAVDLFGLAPCAPTSEGGPA